MASTSPGALLEADRLTVRYGHGRRAVTAVDGVSFALPAGTTLGVVGESGCGKSTIARALVGLVGIAGGRLMLRGVDTTSAKVRSSAGYIQRVQMVFQDPHSSLNPRMRIGQTLADGLAVRRERFPGRAAQNAEIERLLQLVGLPGDAAERYPHQFSGGQKQRISIARALSTGAELLVLDEVTSALDVSVQATVLNLLRRLQQELGLTYVFISHDLSIVRAMSHQVAVMYMGRFVEHGPAVDVLDEPVHPYTAGLVDSVPTLLGERRAAPLAGELPDPRTPPSGCRFHPRCPVGPLADPAREVCREADPSADAAARVHAAACHFVPRAELTASVAWRDVQLSTTEEDSD